jgi:hypothetical protein
MRTNGQLVFVIVTRIVVLVALRLGVIRGKLSLNYNKYKYQDNLNLFLSFLCSLNKSNQECICTPLGISLLCGGPCSSLALMRTKVRTSFKLEVSVLRFGSNINILDKYYLVTKGSLFDDYLYACCCSCCTAIQIYRELKFRGEI